MIQSNWNWLGCFMRHQGRRMYDYWHISCTRRLTIGPEIRLMRPHFLYSDKSTWRTCATSRQILPVPRWFVGRVHKGKCQFSHTHMPQRIFLTLYSRNSVLDCIWKYMSKVSARGERSWKSVPKFTQPVPWVAMKHQRKNQRLHKSSQFS